MSSARLELIFIAIALAGCGGMAAKSSDGIPLGATGPHAVQPLPDKPRSSN